MAENDNLINVPGYAQTVFYNDGIQYRNFSPDLVGNQYLDNTNTPLFFYSGNKDNIYNLAFQKKCAKLLEPSYSISWTIIDGLDHHTKIVDEYDFVFKNFSLLL